MAMTRARTRITERARVALVMTAALGASACGSERKPAAEEAKPAAGEQSGKATSEALREAQAAPAGAAAAGAKAKDPASPAAAPPPAAAPAATSPIPAEARQLIVAVTEDWSAVPARLSRWEREAGGAWRAVGEPWTGVVGSGTGWGRGLHGEGAPAGQAGPQKQEGDGRAPAGVFALGGAYGYAGKPPKGTRWSYTPVDKSWYCVDDSASRSYGTILDADQLAEDARDWSSAETMKRRDALYTWVVDVAHNPGHAARAGSCIFLHVWRAEGSPTVGCTAMPKPALEAVLGWLDPAARPTYVLLPRAAYAELTAAWNLPAL
jgi:L,D-peptidoglycan transpeptidase YkuD (ErfK/YbiS/YcfS/YnhG family)